MERPVVAQTEPAPDPSRRGFILRLFSFIGTSLLALFGRRTPLSAEIYASPTAHRVYLPAVMKEGKDPISDKDPGEKDPTSDKDPNEKTPGEKDPNEKDPGADKDPGEKDKDSEGSDDRPMIYATSLLFDEWSPS